MSRLVRYAFLAPEVAELILSGCQPARLTVDPLKESIPLDWSEQRSLFGLLE